MQSKWPRLEMAIGSSLSLDHPETQGETFSCRISQVNGFSEWIGIIFRCLKGGTGSNPETFVIDTPQTQNKQQKNERDW
ncbi:hypothetical protein Y1Q_0011330 [Alligator mississippiensis]|uniref:Uncharacterized protein n=1 Tax=Alligator mississippiensis TaxID=8496 RepID=A0A151N872_ALLMI|nr:hypothetical protein Y1Q_0011330 [Alligator mississippiensis]